MPLMSISKFKYQPLSEGEEIPRFSFSRQNELDRLKEEYTKSGKLLAVDAFFNEETLTATFTNVFNSREDWEAFKSEEIVIQFYTERNIFLEPFSVEKTIESVEV
jgi:hypothetical protein